MNNKKVLFLTQGAVIAALYTALTLAFAPISFGAVQFRISEALAILPVFTPAAIPGVTLGCFLSNLIGGAHILDIVFGTLATLLGALGTHLLRRRPYAGSLPPIVSNTLIIPWVLRFAYGESAAIPFVMATVGLGEILAIGGLGTLLLFFLQKNRLAHRLLSL